MNMVRRGVRIRIAALGITLLVVPFLGACLMHSFGQGVPADMHRSRSADRRTTTLVKEVQRDDVTVTLEVPPLRAGRESELLVKVRGSGSNAPIRGTRVSIAVVPLQAGAAHEPSPGGSTVTILPREANPGVYVASHTFDNLGSYEIVAEVHAGFESGYHTPLVVAARQEVFSGMDTMSRRARTPLFVLGALGMLVMMGAFML